MKASTPITIVCVCDNYYVTLLAALIKSIEINHLTNEMIQLYIIEDRVTENNKRKLQKSINSDIVKLGWIEMQNSIPSNLKLPSDGTTYPMNVYMRLFIPTLISPDISKVIYLDVDMIVQEDISNLWNIDIGENIVAAVIDPIIKIVSNFGGIKNYEEFGLTPTTKYFNSGLLIIDVKKWLEFNIAEKVIKCINANKKFVKFADQYGLNAVLANKWSELNPLWNSHAEFEIEEPFLIHFSGRKPIFNSYKNNQKYKTAFYKYLQQTEWRNFKPTGETKRYIKKLKNMIEKFNLF